MRFVLLQRYILVDFFECLSSEPTLDLTNQRTFIAVSLKNASDPKQQNLFIVIRVQRGPRVTLVVCFYILELGRPSLWRRLTRSQL